ncbi:MAG: YafY family transcriptional regulator [Anaerolineae bacterium]|nr:YafY family transcriptional regulator [Anaerolineae bacterium]
MRADRLLSLLMLLQTRGTLTAQALAAELEVTERTIYRDVTALSASGVPVYTERGPGGGIALVEDYRTNLTGLNADEVRALFMLSIPAPLDQLGVGDELRMALLKLSAALPVSRRADESTARQKIHLDAAGWFQPEEPTPHLKTIQSALWSNRQLEITYRSDFSADVEMVIAPYGLVAKANIWYLVGAREDHVRVLRISRIRQASLRAEAFERPATFDLPGFWKTWCDEFESTRPQFPVTLRVSPTLAKILSENRPETLTSPPAIEPDGWQTITLTFESLEAARTRILGYGGAAEVLAPLSLRLSLADFARQTLSRYAG